MPATRPTSTCRSCCPAGSADRRPRPCRQGLAEAFQLRGDVDTIADFGDGNPFYARRASAGRSTSSRPTSRAIVASGQLGYAWQTLDGRPASSSAARRGRRSRDLFFVFPTAASSGPRSSSASALVVRD